MICMALVLIQALNLKDYLKNILMSVVSCFFRALSSKDLFFLEQPLYALHYCNLYRTAGFVLGFIYITLL